MVRRLLSLLSLDVEGVHGAAYLLALSSFLSQILALVRDRLLAHHFGAGTELDVYYAAFRVQDFIFYSVASLVSLAVLIPILVRKIEEGKEQTKRFLSNLLSAFLVAVAVAGGICAFFAPELVALIFPGLMGKGFDSDLIFLTRLLLFSPLILGFSNLLASVTQAYRKFFIYALSPVLYNIGIIIGIVALYPVYGLRGLGFGVIIGALLHLAIQVPFIVSEGLLPRLTLSWNFDELKQVIFLSFPRTLTLSLNHISILVLAGLASLLSAGSISVLNFSFNLASVPVSIIGASYSVAAFPILARHFVRKEEREFMEHLSVALKHILFWSIPAVIIFIVMRAQIVRVILGSGAFSWDNTRLTAACLALLALSVIPQNIALLFARSFYAAGETSRPLFASLFSSAATVILSYGGLIFFREHPQFQYFLESLLRVEDIKGTEVLILPLAFALGSFVNLTLFYLLFRRFLSAFTFSVGTTAFHSLSASFVMGFVTYEALEYLGRIFDLNTFLGVFFQGLFAGIAGLIVLVGILYLLKNREFMEILNTLHRKVFQAEVVQTDASL